MKGIQIKQLFHNIQDIIDEVYNFIRKYGPLDYDKDTKKYGIVYPNKMQFL